MHGSARRVATVLGLLGLACTRAPSTERTRSESTTNSKTPSAVSSAKSTEPGCPNDPTKLDECVEHGFEFYRGEGGPKDLSRAAMLFSSACERGHSKACGQLGFMHDQGLGVSTDWTRARELYTGACA